jgi:hypothetical protein
LITLFSFIAAADDSNSSNAIDYNLTFNKYSDNPRYVSPQPMEFGANVSKSSAMTVNSLENQTRKHVYIQFYERPTNITAKKLELENYGIKLVGRAGGYATWIASMPASLTPADIPAEAGLRWMGEIPPEDKWGSNSPEVPDRARMGPGMIYVGIRMYEDVPLNDSKNLRDKYANTSSKYEIYLRSDDRNLIYEFVTNESNLTLIASEDAIKGIWFLPPREALPGNDLNVPSPTTNTSSTPKTNASPVSDTNGDYSVPGFGVLCSLTAFLLLFYMRYRR